MILNSIGFTLLFLIFEFHKGNELLIKYFPIELTVIIFSYIILAILFGVTSIIGLKEFMKIYKKFQCFLFEYTKNTSNF